MPVTHSPNRPCVLLTGGSGFVGRHALPALDALGLRVRCGSRDPDRARAVAPNIEWTRLDLDDPSSVATALAGVSHAIYLVHSLGDGRGYYERERRYAQTFANAATSQNLERVVYLGGVAPHGLASPHLRSRLDTGLLLRESAPHTIELRASMIIGKGSASWQMVRDSAVRLPALVLPRWFDNRSSPIAIDDVVYALCAALTAPLQSGWYDIPGPENLSHRMLFERVGRVLGRSVTGLRLPWVTPTLAAYWLGATSEVPYALMRELVLGLLSDLSPGDRPFWEHVAPHPLRPVTQAIHSAIEDETVDSLPSNATRERIVKLVAGLSGAASTPERDASKAAAVQDSPPARAV